MAFSMDNITSIKKIRKGMTRELFGVIGSDYRLTTPVKLAFEVYVEHILTTSGTTKISVPQLKCDINKILAYNCDMQAVIITKSDVAEVENQIIYDIKKGIELGSIKYIKYAKTAEEEFKRIDNRVEQKAKQKKVQNSEEKIVDKFGAVITREQMKDILSGLEVI